LGRRLCGNLRQRSQTEFENRIKAAWAKFHKHRTTLMNKNVASHLRLKLFQSAVSPTVLFGLSSLPLTRAQLDQLDAVQRRMLRSVVGWAPLIGQDWESAMRRTNARLQLALDRFPIEDWTLQLATRQHKLAEKLARREDSWPARAIRWDPRVLDIHSPSVAQRGPGRPRRKWYDYLRTFAAENFPQSAEWIQSARRISTWTLKLPTFQEHFCS